MKIEFTADTPNPPENMSLKGRLGYKYFFESGWACCHNESDIWIVTDEACNLDKSLIFPDTESFISWLEGTVDDHLCDDPVRFLRLFVSVPDLIDTFVAEAMVDIIGG